MFSSRRAALESGDPEAGTVRWRPAMTFRACALALPLLACANGPSPKPQSSQVMVAQTEDSLTSRCGQNPTVYCRLLWQGDGAGPMPSRSTPQPAPAPKPAPAPRVARPAPEPAPTPTPKSWLQRVLPWAMVSVRDSAPRKKPRPPDDDTCLLVSTGGGFTWNRPGKCYYECRDGVKICKQVQGYQVPCPGAATWQVPFSEIKDLEDCE